MPRENRKRGRKHKKPKEELSQAGHQEVVAHASEADYEPQAGPSWIVPAPAQSEVDRDAPFGYVDPEVKAYFRTVDVQIREWQEQGGAMQDNDDVDPNEDRTLFFVSALTEMSGKEKQLATDPDCSTVLERMAYSMDDFVRRVFMDRLMGSFEQLVTHRFASHVCQTMFAVASDTVLREARGIIASAPESSDVGELRTLTRLVMDACEEMLPSLPSLVVDPFASHVIRALLLLLAPDCFSKVDGGAGSVRSKKSASYKVRQGPMKSVFSDRETGTLDTTAKRAPPEFYEVAKKFVLKLRKELGDNEVRALAADKVASPVLQMLLEVEAGSDMADTPGSMMDRALAGLITLSHQDDSVEPEASDYLMTLLRDPTASHLLETLVHRSPAKVFKVLWATYFRGKLPKLAMHPVANFVVAKALERVGASELEEACQELDSVLGKLSSVESSRTGVLRALVDRAAALHAHEGRVVEAVCAAFELTSSEERELAVLCILRTLALNDYKAAMSTQAESSHTTEGNTSNRRAGVKAEDNSLEPKLQGSLLLQSMLRLPSPHNELVLDSVTSLSVDELIAMAHNTTSSRVLDVLLESPTVSNKAKRKFVLAFIGHFHTLVDDRIGSRVGERCWAYADPYLKEKIARSVIPHEYFLAGSMYGKFFTRNLNLHLLQRKPDQWRDQQSVSKAASSDSVRSNLAQLSAVTATAAVEVTPADEAGASADKPKKRKHKTEPEDEIDALFNARLSNKVRKGGLGAGKDAEQQKSNFANDLEDEQSGETRKQDILTAEDKDLKDVLGAIRAAPKDNSNHRKKVKKR